jgi:hypothetical protein
MEAAVIELVEAGLLQEGWHGLLYVMGWGAGSDFRPLYVGKAERKGVRLNIFLRDAFYNVYLRTEYRLEAAELWYEVPLDSHVAKALEARAKAWKPRVVLRRWTTIKDLQPDESECYQAFAKEVAEAEERPGRVHLDLLYFRAQTTPMAYR